MAACIRHARDRAQSNYRRDPTLFWFISLSSTETQYSKSRTAAQTPVVTSSLSDLSRICLVPGRRWYHTVFPVLNLQTGPKITRLFAHLIFQLSSSSRILKLDALWAILNTFSILRLHLTRVMPCCSRRRMPPTLKVASQVLTV